MDRIVIQTPARLHFGLIDMNGEIGRIDGGMGLALEFPHTTIEAKKAGGVRVTCRDDPEVIGRLETALRAVCDHYEFPGAEVNVHERPLPHVGLGSETQAMVGAAHAVCSLYGHPETSRKLAQLVDRGGTSGIGVEAIRSGGLILDAGHSFRRGKNGKQGYLPSSASKGIEPPPTIARHNFPDWDILVAVPLGEGASGLREITLFKVVCPIPIDQVRQMCHIIVMQMIPAALERDLEAFGGAMEEFQKLGFKVFELRAQTDLLKSCIRFLKESGGIGVGMSSWGPSVYCFGEDLFSLKEKAQQWLDSHGGGETILTKANNVGMRIITEE